MTKKLFIAVVLLAVFGLFSFNYVSESNLPETGKDLSGLRKMNNTSFQEGEKLSFKFHYGWISAGVAELEIANRPSKINGRDCYKIVGTGRTSKSFDWFFYVRDHYESYVDKQSIFPWRFVRDVNEDGYIIKRDITFDQESNTAQCKFDDDKRLFSLPENIQDMMSSFYFARVAIDFSNIKKGDYYIIPIFMDYEVYPLRIKYIGKEDVKTTSGKFRCLVFKPAVQEGRIFEDNEDLTIYVSDDKNKIPVQVKADVLVGSLKLSLTDYSGMRNPVTSRLD